MAVNKNNVKIHVEHLKKSFGKLEVLRDVSTDIYEGEVVVILGPSGSGKSTFLRCLNRLEEITGGTVIVDGHDVTDKKTDLNKMRENVGMVFQHFNLFNNLNVMGNMTLAPVELKKGHQGRGEGKGAAPAGARGPVRQSGRLPGPAFRRPEAACGHCPRSGDGPGHYAV